MPGVKKNRSRPMAVKYWTFAGLLLTDRCPACCEACYLNLPGEEHACMNVETALRIWRELQEASPHGCRVHLTGGEPFTRWSLLIAVARQGSAAGLGPLEKVETNGFWARDKALIRERLTALDRAGMKKLSISADPFHQQFVPLQRVRLLARVAEDLLGPDRVQVRWRDWMACGTDTAHLADKQRQQLFVDWLSRGRDRLNGRAAELLADTLDRVPPEQLAEDCRERLLRNRHVHVSPGGEIWPGVCAGIVIGRTGAGMSVAGIRERLIRDYADRPILGRLVRGGPAELLGLARETGFQPAAGYAGKCHLCWKIRAHLWKTGGFTEELGPACIYA